MKLSVIIVNFNVKYFLEQAILSAQKAAQLVDGKVEIIVVDNNSKDGSVKMMLEKFPDVTLFAEDTNHGFSKGNNIGIENASGEFVLLLNPDTVVEEDTFLKCINFMNENNDAGALGVKMIDGSGKFLPESKRALPSPEVAFYKIFGLANVFPKSKRFGKYHLSYLPENENNEVDILSGAFMFIRKSVLDKVGGFDETFFMYGEDIDLSYRIQKAGFKNYYFPQTRIIHYKGESTKKGSLNYVKMFYRAMSIFAKKHYSKNQAGIFNLAIQTAIVFRAVLDLILNFVKNLWLPFLDGLAIALGFVFLKNQYLNFKAATNISFPEELLYFNLPIYVLVWLLSIFFSGGYDLPLKLGKLLKGILLGSVAIAALYGFLPENLRFSRALILLSTGFAFVVLPSLRLLLNVLFPKYLHFKNGKEKKLAIVGSESESKRVQEILKEVGIAYQFGGNILPKNANELPSTIELNKIDELIFCSKDLSSNQIIDLMVNLNKNLNFRIVPEKSKSIVGSNSKNIAGDLYAIDLSLNINKVEQKRNKRVFDLAICCLTFLLSPLLLVFNKNPLQLVSNWWNIFLGSKSWVGYDFKNASERIFELPKIKPGLLTPAKIANESVDRINYLYAKDYSTKTDFTIVLKNWKRLSAN